MQMPVGRIFIISIITLLWLVLAVMGLRKIGLNDQFQSFEHPLLKNEYWLVAWGGDPTEHQAMTRASFKAAANLSDNIILGASVQSVKGGKLVLAEKHFIFTDGELTFLSQLSFEEWKKANPDGLSLEEFLAEFPGRTLYLNFDRLNVLDTAQLVLSLKPLKERKRILVKSSPQGIKKSLKEKQPLWLYSNTTAEIGKLKVMLALFLEPIASLNADFFVDKSFNPRLLTEIRRRNKKAIFKPGPDDFDVLLKAKNYDGIVTTRPSEFLSLVD